MLDIIMGAVVEVVATHDRPAPQSISVSAVAHGRHHPSMNGVRPSTYRGHFFTAASERLRLCVIQRESNGHYWSVNSGGYAGAYQFSRDFARGLPYNVARALRIDGWPDALASKMRRVLSSIPIQKWSRKMQDTAFFATLNYSRPFSGFKHWSLRGSRCNGLAGG